MVATLRNKSNPYFARENHKRVAKNQRNKTWIDTDGPLPPDGGGVVFTSEALRQVAISRLSIQPTRNAWYADPAASGDGSGTSWTNAFTTLAAAFAAAASGDVVYSNASQAVPFDKEVIPTALTRVEWITDAGPDGITWVDGRNVGSWTDAGGGVWSLAVATQPELVSYDFKQDDIAGTVTGIDLNVTRISDALAEWGLAKADCAAWYGFLPKAASATVTPAEGEWSWVSGVLYVNPPGSPVKASVDALTAYSNIASAVHFTGDMNDCYCHGKLRTFWTPALAAPDGYGVRIDNGTRCTLADHVAIMPGSHASGMIGGSNEGNQIIDCLSVGHSALTAGTGAAIPWVFYADGDDILNAQHVGFGLSFIAFPPLKTNGAPLGLNFTPAFGYSHTAGASVLAGIDWVKCLQIDFIGQLRAKHAVTLNYDQNAARFARGVNTGAMLDIRDAGLWPIRVRDSMGIGEATMPYFSTDNINCRFDRTGFGATTSTPFVCSTAAAPFRMTGGGYIRTGDFLALFESMSTADIVRFDGVTIYAQNSLTARLFRANLATEMVVLKGCTFLTDRTDTSLVETLAANLAGFANIITSEGGNRYDVNWTASARVIRASALGSGTYNMAQFLAAVDPLGRDQSGYTP